MILYWISGLWIIDILRSLYCRLNRKEYLHYKDLFESGYLNWKVSPKIDKYYLRHQKETKLKKVTT